MNPNGMNKIEKLIDELCPEGVEFKELGEVCEGTQNIKWQNNTEKTFQYIDLTSVDRTTHTIADTKIIDAGSFPPAEHKKLLPTAIFYLVLHAQP